MRAGLFGTRPHQQHVSPKHIPQLGQLVEVHPAQKSSRRHDTSVFDIREHRTRFIGHGSDFQNPKGLIMKAHAILPKKEGARNSSNKPNEPNDQQHEDPRYQEHAREEALHTLRQTTTQRNFWGR
jgi:hypothetical protein